MEAQALAKVQEQYTRIDRSALIVAIEKNRETHEKEYKIAIVGWRKEALSALKKHQGFVEKVIGRIEADIKEDKPVKTLNGNNIFPDIPTRPQNHTQDYDSLITRLKMSQDTIIHLSHSDFKNFGLDLWACKAAHTAAISNYGNFDSPNLAGDFGDYADD